MSHRTYLVIGFVLVAAALIGFLAVADDLRHPGEAFAVLGIAVSGAALLVAGLLPQALSVLALQWIPVGVALGAAAGVLTDQVVLGVSAGTAVGLVLARHFRARGPGGSFRQPPA